MVTTDSASKEKRELPAHIHEMTRPEIDQFLCCAPVGRLAMIARGRPYVIPVGFVWWEGRIGIHVAGIEKVSIGCGFQRGSRPFAVATVPLRHLGKLILNSNILIN